MVSNQNPPEKRLGPVLYLLYLCSIPFGGIFLIPTGTWLTPTKLVFFILLAGVSIDVIRGWRPTFPKGFTLSLFVFLAGAFLASLLSYNPSISFIYFLRFGGLGMLCMLTMWYAKEENNVRRILLTLLGIASVLAVLGSYQTLSGKTLANLGVYSHFGRLVKVFLQTENGEVSLLRSCASFDNANLFGTFLIASIPIGLLDVSRRGKTSVKSIFMHTGTLLCLIALVFTLSRSAWLGFCFSFLIIMVKQTNRKKMVGVTIIALMTAAWLLPAGSRAILWNRGYSPQYYDSGRLYSYRAAMHMMSSNLFAGTGPGMFDPVYDQYRPDNEIYLQNPLHKMDAHNTFLDLGAEGGLVSLIPFLFVLLLVSIRLGRYVHQSIGSDRTCLKPRTVQALAILAGLTAIVIQSFFQSLEYQEVFWILLGAGFSAGNKPLID